MKKLIYLSASAALLLSIITSCKQVPTTQTINGIVYDASMNNITVISNQGDTINISTMDTNPQKVPGVLLNDSVKVTCSTENIDGVQVLKAAELTVTAHSPYYYIQGTWLEPNPINAQEMQGFTLNPNGTAQSVNMATLRKNAGTTERDGRNDAKRLCTNVVTVSDEVKPKKRKMQGKAEYSRRTVCKSLPKKM